MLRHPALSLLALAMLEACHSASPVRTLSVGDTLPAAIAGQLPAAPCVVAVLTARSCGVSRALSVQWAPSLAAIADSAGVTISTAWLVAEDTDSLALGPFHDPGPMVSLAPSFGLHDYLEGGVTPQTLVIDGHGVIRQRILGNFLPDAASMARDCAN